MRKKNNMRHRNNGGRRHHNNGGGRSGGGNDSGNVARQKHHATQMREKYFNLARDAQSNGDRVDVEYYLQHVDHYVRVLADIAVIEAERFAERQAQQQANGQAQDAQPSDQSEGGQDDNNASGGDNGGQDVDLRNQPRMTRPPRQQHQHGGQQAAKEIPLPGSILTEIPV